ncbi:MAG: TIGR01212 family radical SAM protein [Spirochaetales bacterium]|jgi:radical SAM protein (TIGR01212 family)|nr:TIGR01212 family radical SAM protein [Spirochaetales bacterium]
MKGFPDYSAWLESRYGAKTYRVSVDAGFSCPNREAGRSRGGCSFCGSRGSRSPYLGAEEEDPAAGRNASIAAQVAGGMAFLRRRYKARQFLLYFQAFSGTHAPAAELKAIYDYALSLADFRQLIVSTRPDCVDAEKAGLLAGYARPDRDVWVELGLQSAREQTLTRIRRGHGRAEFENAFRLLRERGIKIAVHLVFGLPGENTADIEASLEYLAGFAPEGVKIHNLHIVRGSALYDEFLAGELSLPCAARHIQYITRAFEILPKGTLFMRFTCDTPAELLAYPRRFPDKARFLRMLRS